MKNFLISALLAALVCAASPSFAAARKLSVASSYRTLSSQTGANILRLRSSAKTTEQLIEELKDAPGIRSVQPNYASRAAGNMAGSTLKERTITSSRNLRRRARPAAATRDPHSCC